MARYTTAIPNRIRQGAGWNTTGGLETRNGIRQHAERNTTAMLSQHGFTKGARHAPRLDPDHFYRRPAPGMDRLPNHFLFKSCVTAFGGPLGVCGSLTLSFLFKPYEAL